MPPSDTGRPDGYVPPCIPTRAVKPPAGVDWVHEIKHDGYRLQVRRVGDQVSLFTRRGYDWSTRYPAIAVTAMLLRAKSFTLDGEAVVCGPDGVAIFDALHRHGTVSEAMLYAFDLLELDRRGSPRAAAGRPQEAPGEAAERTSARHRAERPHRRGWRHHLSAGMRHGPGGDRLEAAERALQIRPVDRVAEDQEPG
jgi:ATP dependent DNA ligase domain